METNLPADKVADLQAKPAPAAEPAKPAAQPASQTDDEPDPAKPAGVPAPQEPAQPEPVKREKPKPIAKLLEERHTLREKVAKLEAELEKAAAQPPSQAKADRLTALKEKYSGVVDDQLLTDIIEAARDGLQAPQLPKEVQSLIAREQAAQAEAAENQAFDDDFGRLAKSIPDPEIKDPKAKEKLKQLAYSEEKAPDGEPYFKKSLVELFYSFVKPEIEPGKPSAESSQGGSKASGKVLDFAQIAADPAALSEFAKTATKAQFAKFHAWQLENEKEPLRKPGF